MVIPRGEDGPRHHLQQPLDEPRRQNPSRQCPLAGLLERCRAIPVGQADNAVCGAHALLDMAARGEPAVDIGRGGDPDRRRFGAHLLRRAAGDGAVADQVRFEREWGALRSYAAQRGVRLIGDIPIYVAPGSADHVTHPELFVDGIVSGAPPDQYTDEWQLWGNPLYDWPALQRRRYRWWTERFRRVLAQVDRARIDHFRGFEAAWHVPVEAPTARDGRWVKGPGAEILAALIDTAGPGTLVAEDLGVITPAVDELRTRSGLPGMKVLQFAFDGTLDNPYLPANHEELSVVYTGTHDNDTTAGWWASTPPARSNCERISVGMPSPGVSA